MEQDRHTREPLWEDNQGVSVVQHLILESDTFEGICLRYKVKANRLRQLNCFSGTNLRIVPQMLKIPIDPQHRSSIQFQDEESPEYATAFVAYNVPRLSLKGVKAYLNICDGNVEKAIQEARNDLAWEQENLGELMIEKILSMRDESPWAGKQQDAYSRSNGGPLADCSQMLLSFHKFLATHGVFMKDNHASEEVIHFELHAMTRYPSLDDCCSTDSSSSSSEDSLGVMEIREKLYSVQMNTDSKRVSVHRHNDANAPAWQYNPNEVHRPSSEASRMQSVVHKLHAIVHRFQPAQKFATMPNGRELELNGLLWGDKMKTS